MEQRLGCLPPADNMTKTFPAPFPENGLRKLSAKALACTLPKNNKATYSGQVFVGIFFDGTGNNRENDHLKPPEKLKETA